MNKGQDVFRDFVAARSAALARTAYLLTGDRHLAEDLLQEALTRVAGRWDRVAAAGNPEPYVRRVLYTCAVDGWRRKRPAEVLDGVPPELAGPGDDAEVVARRVVLRDALARLTPHQRAVLVLRFYEDRTEAQAADVLGCSVSTVKSQTRHALARLRALAPELAASFVSGYPRRVAGRQPDRALTAAPGAMAAVLPLGDGWYVMSSRGTRWRLPVTDVGPDRPVLSRDGRMLGYPLGDSAWGDEGARYVIHDLVTGRRVEFVLTPSQRIKDDFGYTLGELPGFWSPDGRRLVVWGGPRDRYLGPALVLDSASGAATALRLDAMPVGWSSDERIVWLRWDGTKDADTDPLPPYEVIETDIAGRPIRSVRLAETGGYVDLWQRPEHWSAAVSADGKSLALIDRNPSKNAVRRFDLSTGAETGPATPVDDVLSHPCGITWGKAPALVLYGYDGVVRTESLTAADPTTVSVVSPRLDTGCITWASGALDGAARGGGLLGTSTSLWSWWWREWIAGILAAVGAVALLRWMRSRVRRRRPARPLPPNVDWYAE